MITFSLLYIDIYRARYKKNKFAQCIPLSYYDICYVISNAIDLCSVCH